MPHITFYFLPAIILVALTACMSGDRDDDSERRDTGMLAYECTYGSDNYGWTPTTPAEYGLSAEQLAGFAGHERLHQFQHPWADGAAGTFTLRVTLEADRIARYEDERPDLCPALWSPIASVVFDGPGMHGEVNQSVALLRPDMEFDGRVYAHFTATGPVYEPSVPLEIDAEALAYILAQAPPPTELAAVYFESYSATSYRFDLDVVGPPSDGSVRTSVVSHQEP